jgi:F-type H+-transporting ATPase subunit epsilon
MAKLTLDVVTPNGVVFSDNVDAVFVEAIDGDLGILPDHIPLFTAMKMGILTYHKDNVTDYLALMGGFIEVSNNKVTVLSSSGEKAGDIDALRAKQDREQAERELMAKKGDIDFAHAEKEIIKSSVRLKAVELLEQSGRTRRKL